MTGAVVTVEYLDAALGTLRGEMHGIRDELRGEMHGIRDELRGDMKAMEERLKSEIGSVVSHFANVLFEQMRAMIAPIDEKLNHFMREFEAHRADDTIHRKVRRARPRSRRT